MTTPDILLTAAGALVGLWILAKMKTSRADGVLMGSIHPYRRMMQIIMPTRVESTVYLDVWAPSDELTAYVEEANALFPTGVTHAVVAAANQALLACPPLNSFVMGRRLYERNHREITFSMKRKKLNREAKLATVKLRMADGETFRELSERIDGKINHERSGEKTYADKEFDLFGLLPRAGLRAAAWGMRWLDYHNLLPASFIENDALYTSAVIANVGSLDLPPGYHHLYEWGNCGWFLMVGHVEERAVAREGEVVVERGIQVRIAFDERVEDGLSTKFGMEAFLTTLTQPRTVLGCLAEDGSDTHPMEIPPRDT